MRVVKSVITVPTATLNNGDGASLVQEYASIPLDVLFSTLTRAVIVERRRKQMGAYPALSRAVLLNTVRGG